MRIHFDNGKTLDIEPYGDTFSQRWYNEVKSQKDNLWEKHRLYNLNDEWTIDKIFSAIREQLHVVWVWDPHFNWEMKDDMNFMHVYFENMIGIDKIVSEERSEYYESAPQKVKDAICELNVLVHRLESLKKTRLVCTFRPHNRYMLKTNRFNFRQVPGNVCINYCQVGKPPYDVYHDQDHHISEENISPQVTWSADFNITWDVGRDWDPDYRPKATQWCKENNIEMKSWGLITVGYTTTEAKEIYGAKKIEKISF